MPRTFVSFRLLFADDRFGSRSVPEALAPSGASNAQVRGIRIGGEGGRRSVASFVLALLLLAMAAGQFSDVDGYARILGGYRVFGDMETTAAVAIAVAEACVGLVLLFRGRLPRPVIAAGGVGGLVVAALWTALAAQAFARGLQLENCGCFGVHLGQELRWWILLEDAEFLLLALLAARASGVPLLAALARPTAAVNASTASTR